MKTFVFFTLLFISCVTSQNSKESKNSVNNITARQWIAGVQGGGGGVVLNVYLNKNTNSLLIPTHIQYQGRQAELILVEPGQYQGNIKTMENREETVPTPTANFNLKPTEARVLFVFNNKKQSIIFANVKELELIAYPTAKPIED